VNEREAIVHFLQTVFHGDSGHNDLLNLFPGRFLFYVTKRRPRPEPGKASS
jgi:hypothetical protein